MANLAEALNIGLISHQNGDYTHAEMIYREILKVDPNQGDALHLLGVLCHQSGKLPEAEGLFKHALHVNDQVPEFYNSLGNILCDQGKPSEAIMVFQTGLEIAPHSDDLHLNLAIAYQELDNTEKAIEHYQKALELNPTAPDIYNNFGNMLRKAGRPLDGLTMLNQAVTLNPNYMEAYYNLSSLYQELNQYDLAMQACLKVIELKPDFADALDALGSLHYQQGRIEEALHYYKKAVELNPSMVKAYFNLAGVLYFSEKLDDALNAFQRVLLFEPSNEEALSCIGDILYKKGHFEESRYYFDKASQLNPSRSLLKWRSETVCPFLAASPESIQIYRQNLEAKLDEYDRTDFSFNPEELLYTGCQPSFYLAYHGFNDNALKSKYGDIFSKKFNQLFPNLMEPPVVRPKNKAKIAYLVTATHEGVFCKLTLGYINLLPRDQFEVWIICTAHSKTLIEHRIKNADVHYCLVPTEKLEESIQTIKSHQFDVIHYYEIGTDPMNYFLPFFNLAPIQISSFGFPITSGIPNMNYFVSSKMVEPANAQEEYREHLVQLGADPIYFYRPAPLERVKSRAEMGLPENKTIYFCPQNTFKFHPDFDTLIARVLDEDPNGEVVIIQNLRPNWTQTLLDRFAANPTVRDNPAIIDRLRIYPRVDHLHYLNLIANADVILDTVHYTGGTTSFEGLAFGVPIVTQPFNSTRSRQTYGNYNTMGMMECVVDSPESYIQKAVQLGTDREYRLGVKDEILAKHGVLYENQLVIDDMARFLTEALETLYRTGENQKTPFKTIGGSAH